MFTDLDSLAIAISRRMSNMCGATLPLGSYYACNKYKAADRLTLAIRHIRES